MKVVGKLIDVDYAEHVKHELEREENTVFVSELVLCKQRSLFNKQFKMLYQPQNATIIGRLIHSGLEAFLQVYFNAQVEVEVSREICGYVVKGRVDALTEDEVIEIKSGLDHKGSEPLEHHRQQVRLYMWLTGKPRGRIVYVTYGHLSEYEVNDPASDDEVMYMIDNWLSPRYDWECEYCQWRSICPYRVERKR